MDATLPLPGGMVTGALLPFAVLPPRITNQGE